MQDNGNAARSSRGGDDARGLRTEPKALFNVSAPFRGSFAGFAVTDGARAFIGGYDKFLYAYDVGGKLLWRVCLGKSGPFPSDPCGEVEDPLQPALLADGSAAVVFIKHRPNNNVPFAYDLVSVSTKSGAVLWRVPACDELPLLLVLPVGDLAYWCGQSFLRVSSSSGKPVWNTTVASDVRMRGTVPMTYVAKDDSIWTGYGANIGKVVGVGAVSTCVVTDTHARRLQFAAASGKLVLNATIGDDVVYRQMLYDEDTGYLYVPANQLSVYVYDAVTGTPKYRLSGNEVSVGTNTIVTVAQCPKGGVVVLNDYGDFTLWDEDAMQTGKVVWRLLNGVCWLLDCWIVGLFDC